MINYIVLLVFNIIFIIIVSLFTISTLIAYKKQKEKIALYLSLVFCLHLLFILLMAIRNIDGIIFKADTTFSNNMMFFGQIFIILSFMLSLSFCNELSKINSKLMLFGYICGLIIVIYFTLPINYGPSIPGEFSPRYIGFTLMMIYGLIIYTYLSRHFYALYKKTIGKKPKITALLIGMILWAFYMIYSFLFSFNPTFEGTLISYSIYLMILICFFRGIYLPKLKANT